MYFSVTQRASHRTGKRTRGELRGLESMDAEEPLWQRLATQEEKTYFSSPTPY